MKRLLIAILVVALVVLAFPMAAFADGTPPAGPNTNVNVGVTTPGNVNLGVNVNAGGDTNVQLSGIATNGVTVDGDPVVTSTGMSTAFANYGQGMGPWENSVGSQLYEHHRQILALAGKLGLDEQALDKLIQQTSFSAADIQLLHTYSNNIFSDLGQLTKELDSLNSQVTTQNTAMEAEIQVLKAENVTLRANYQTLLKNVNYLENVHQQQLAAEHQGVIGHIRDFFTSVGQWFASVGSGHSDA